MSILENQINEYFIIKKNLTRIEQGDLLSDIPISQVLAINEKEIISIDINFHHVLVLSQDCDLEQFFNAQNKDKNNIGPYLHNVIITPCFYRDEIESGKCLEYMQITQEPLSRKIIEKIHKDELMRYQHIRKEDKLFIPDLYIDFKAYYAISPTYLYSMYNKSYLATINALFRERITQRYTNYVGRIGIPVLG